MRGSDGDRLLDIVDRCFEIELVRHRFASQSILKRDGRDLVAEFRALAPPRQPISLQRWGPQRVLMATGVLALGMFAAVNVYSMVMPTKLAIEDSPTCGTNPTLILMAQAVPRAAAIPCIAALPAGWTVGGATVRNGDAGFWLDSDRFGEHAVEVRIRPADACLVDDGDETPSDEPAWRRFDAPDTGPTRTYLSDAACVTYDITPRADAQSIHTLDDGLAFQPRSALAAEVDRRSGLTLCEARTRCVGESE